MAAKIAREACDRLFANSTAQSADVVKELLRQRQVGFLGMDPDFRVELLLCNEMVGDASDERLRKAVLACLPTADNDFSMAVSLRKLLDVSKAHVFKYGTRGAQGACASVQRCLGKMVEGETPPLKEYATCPIMTEVVARLPFFIRIQMSEDGETPAHELYGARALAEKFKAFQECHGNGTAMLEHASEFEIFSHLMQDDHRVAFATIVKDLHAKAKGSIHAAGIGKSAKAAKAGGKASDPAISSAMDMFK